MRHWRTLGSERERTLHGGAGAGARLQNRPARNSETTPVLERPTGDEIRAAPIPRRGARGGRPSDGRAQHAHSRMGGTTEDASVAIECEVGEAIIDSNATVFSHAAFGSGPDDGGADFGAHGHATRHPRARGGHPEAGWHESAGSRARGCSFGPAGGGRAAVLQR